MVAAFADDRKRTRSASRLGCAFGLLGLLCSVAVLPGCGWDGHFTLLGYTTRPNYDPSIRTMYVPIFKNLTFRRGLEFDLTRAVVKELELKGFKVISDPTRADSQLDGTIIRLNKNILNRNQVNEVREAETILAVEIVWRDLRTGDILSQPRRGPGPPFPTPDPLAPQLGNPVEPAPIVEVPPGLPAPPPIPVLVQSVGGFIPEVGGSLTTAERQNVHRLAVQIVSMMESPW